MILEQCVDGFMQNDNESLNQLVWKIIPKILPAGSKTIEIVALVASCPVNKKSQSCYLFLFIFFLYGMDGLAEVFKRCAERK